MVTSHCKLPHRLLSNCSLTGNQKKKGPILNLGVPIGADIYVYRKFKRAQVVNFWYINQVSRDSDMATKWTMMDAIVIHWQQVTMRDDYNHVNGWPRPCNHNDNGIPRCQVDSDVATKQWTTHSLFSFIYYSTVRMYSLTFDPTREWHGLPVDFHGFFSNQHIEENSLKILQFFLCKSVKKWAFYSSTKFEPQWPSFDATAATWTVPMSLIWTFSKFGIPAATKWGAVGSSVKLWGSNLQRM